MAMQTSDSNGTQVEIEASSTLAEQESAVIAHSDGSFTLFWLADSGDSNVIYGQNFDSTGVAIDEVFIAVAASSVIYSSPMVTNLNNGNLLLAWQGDSAGQTGFDIYALELTISGAPISQQFMVNVDEENAQSYVGLTSLNSGDYVVTWVSDETSGSPSGIYCQIFDEEHNAVSSVDILVNSSQASGYYDTTVTALTNGGFVVAWTGANLDGSNNGVFAQIFDAQGNFVGQEFQVNTQTSRDQEYPAIAPLDTGGFVVSWASLGQDGDIYGVFAQIFDENGAPIGSEFAVNTTTQSDQTNPAIALLSTGDFIIIWQGESPESMNYEVFGQIFSATGEELTEELLLTDLLIGNQINPNVVGTENNGYIVSWTNFSAQEMQNGISGQVFCVDCNQPPQGLVENQISSVGEVEILDLISFFEDPEGNAISISLITELATGFSFDTNSGELSVEAAAVEGVYQIEFIAYDDQGAGVNQQFIWYITGENFVVPSEGEESYTNPNLEGLTEFSLEGGDDRFVATTSIDIFGGEGSDFIAILGADASVDGGSGSDILLGFIGNDELSGGEGDDLVIGDALSMANGQDRLDGGSGDDILMGGGGADIFVFSQGDDIIAHVGGNYSEMDVSALGRTDFSRDYQPGFDRIDLSNYYEINAENYLDFFTQNLNGAELGIRGDYLLLWNVQLSELSADDFIFA